MIDRSGEFEGKEEYEPIGFHRSGGAIVRSESNEQASIEVHVRSTYMQACSIAEIPSQAKGDVQPMATTD